MVPGVIVLLKDNIASPKIILLQNTPHPSELGLTILPNQVILLAFPISTGWAFAAIYPDCIQWFDSNPDEQIPDFQWARDISQKYNLRSTKVGPKQSRIENSGHFMLLGIRQITEGRPHISQQDADTCIQNFRQRILIELLREGLNPSIENFGRIVSRQNDQDSMFFNNAFGLYLSDLQSGSISQQDSMDSPPNILGFALLYGHYLRSRDISNPERSTNLTLDSVDLRRTSQSLVLIFGQSDPGIIYNRDDTYLNDCIIITRESRRLYSPLSSILCIYF